MPLPYLLNVPRTPEEWSVWGFSHRDQHKLVIQAIQAAGGGSLTEYPLDPISLDDFDDFLNWNQRAHNDANGVLGTQGSDLTQANLTDQNQLQAWINLHRREHENWSNALGIS